MSNVVILGTRDHQSLIGAALANMMDTGTAFAKQVLVRSVRIMLMQYHGALLGNDGQRTAPSFDAASSVNEILMELDKAGPEDCGRRTEELRSALKPLFLQGRRSNTLQIAQVRALQDWAVRTSLDDRPRIIVLEGVEQSAEGTRNSLLKLLEDPPGGTYFMLITEHPARMLPTILSRVRPHHVPPLSVEAKNRILEEKFFTDGNSYLSLEQYVLERSGVDCALLSAQAKRFAESVMSVKPMDRGELDKICGELDGQTRLEYFLKEFQAVVRQKFFSGSIDASLASRVVAVTDDAYWKASLFNQNWKLLVESIYYRLQESR